MREAFAVFIGRATWVRAILIFILLFAYAWWAFVAPGFWSRAEAAAGPLPETLPGFPAGQPAAAFARLGEATSDYLIFQAVDIPFAILNALWIAVAIALALRRFDLARSPLRFALIIPGVVLGAEFAEDFLLFMMAADYIPDAGAPALIQQVLTNVKTVSAGAGFLAAVLSVVVVLVADIARLFRGGGDASGP